MAAYNLMQMTGHLPTATAFGDESVRLLALMQAIDREVLHLRNRKGSS